MKGLEAQLRKSAKDICQKYQPAAYRISHSCFFLPKDLR